MEAWLGLRKRNKESFEKKEERKTVRTEDGGRKKEYQNSEDRERDRESHGTIDCRVPWGKSILQGHPILLLQRSILFLLTSSSPLSTSIRVLNSRRKRNASLLPKYSPNFFLYILHEWITFTYIQSRHIAHFEKKTIILINEKFCCNYSF